MCSKATASGCRRKVCVSYGPSRAAFLPPFTGTHAVMPGFLAAELELSRLLPTRRRSRVAEAGACEVGPSGAASLLKPLA